MIDLIAPDTSHPYTGGSLYNERISAELGVDTCSLVYTSAPPPSPYQLKKYGVRRESRLLIDSLFLHFPDWFTTVAEIWSQETSLLIHYLPSQDPSLHETTRMKMMEKERRCLSCSKKIITTSNYNAEKLNELYQDLPPIGVFRPGTKRMFQKKKIEKTPFFQNKGEKIPVLLTVSNWTPSKNQLFLLSVFERLKGKNWIWKSFGDDILDLDLKTQFLREAEKAGLSSQIEVHPAVSPTVIAGEMEQADIFLFPSLFESYGMAVAEALTAGIPVIAHKIGGIPEIIGDSPAATLCDPDHPDAAAEWAKGIESIIEDHTTWNRMTAAALVRAKEFPIWPETAKGIADFLE